MKDLKDSLKIRSSSIATSLSPLNNPLNVLILI